MFICCHIVQDHMRSSYIDSIRDIPVLITDWGFRGPGGAFEF